MEAQGPAALDSFDPATEPLLPKNIDRRSAEEILALRRDRHRVLTQFSRRRKTILLKADQLHRDCQADVYLVVRWKGKTYTYKSIEDKKWPPPEEELMKLWPLTEFAGPGSVDEMRTRKVATIVGKARGTQEDECKVACSPGMQSPATTL